MKLFISENKDKYKTSAEFAALCIAEYSGTDSGKFEIYKDSYGKPRCRPSDGVQYYFSISHSGNMIICAADEYNIGADCQFINRNYESCVKIASRFFHAEELKKLKLCSSEKLYVDLFFEIWTKKEAYVKFIGRGLADGLTRFNSIDEKRARNFTVIPYKKEIKVALYGENFSDDHLRDIVMI